MLIGKNFPHAAARDVKNSFLFFFECFSMFFICFICFLFVFFINFRFKCNPIQAIVDLTWFPNYEKFCPGKKT